MGRWDIWVGLESRIGASSQGSAWPRARHLMAKRCGQRLASGRGQASNSWTLLQALLRQNEQARSYTTWGTQRSWMDF